MHDILERLQRALGDRYAVERELGAGGMAMVYLAEDLRHHRKVALKILRPEIAATLGAGRFAREIEVAARLQHPNILPLLDSGEAEGFFFYVMPFVEGESLRDRLARGGELPIHDAVRILVEVADALSHAHAHGVVHRDIKPDNIMLSGRHALVADFGVAKAVTEATGRQVLTSAGVALGTPAYMAPEQATADPHQDHRVDIYALGVLGYELLTGRAPFSATTAQEMLAAHVTADPEPLEQYRPTVSPALAAVVMKCLAKKPADRWQTAEELLQHLEPLTTPSSGITPAQTAPFARWRSRRRRMLLGTGVCLVLVVSVVDLAYRVLHAKPLDITVSNIVHVTSEPGIEFQPAISPDGNEVAYVAGPVGAWRPFVRGAFDVAGGAAVRLGDNTFDRALFPSWSADGQSVRFLGHRAGRFAWYETGRLGGALRPLPVPAVAVAWSADGSRAAFVRGDTLFSELAGDAAARVVGIQPEGNADLHSPAWSPDGKWIAYVSGNLAWQVTGNVAPSSIWIINSGGGTPVRLTSDANLNVSPTWLDTRHLLFVSNRDGPRAVYVAEVGPRGMRGEPRLVPGLTDPHSISYSIGARTLAWAQFTTRQNIWSYPLERTEPVSIRDGHPLTNDNQVIEQHDVSPDGKWLAFDSNLRGSMDVYRLPLAGGAPEPLTASTLQEEGPRWSPDGTEIAFYSYVSMSRADVMVMPAEGGTPVRLTESLRLNQHPTWSPNGLRIAFQSDRSGSFALWVLSRDSIGGPWHAAAPLGHGACELPEWAPDGSAVACIDESFNLLLISPMSGSVLHRDLLARSRLAWAGGVPRYSRDGRTIYAFATRPDGGPGIWAIPVVRGPARLVVAFDDPPLTGLGFVSVGKDRLYLSVSQSESNIWVAKLRY